MIAGYDTTSLTISNCVHVLSIYPEEAQKLQDEIDSNIQNIVNKKICLIELFKNQK
jgi:cytochrome P450